jgi:site-specific recombinase XerD
MTGHADIDMTQHYLHVQREVKEVAADKLDCLFKKTA